MASISDQYVMLPPVSPWRFALRESNKYLNFAFLTVLVLWLVQDLFIRDLFVPIEKHQKLYHVFDMLSVIWGAFVTGYMFHWVVDHIPRARKRYSNQQDIERHLFAMLDDWRSFHISFFIGHKRDPHEKSHIFRTPFGETPNYWSWMVPADGVEGIGTIMTDIGNYTNDFGSMLESSKDFYLRLSQDILYLKVNLDHDLVDTLEYVQDALSEMEMAEPADVEVRRLDLLNVSEAMLALYDYVGQCVTSNKHIDRNLEKLLKQSSYHDLWDEIEREQREGALKPTRLPNAPSFSVD